MSGTTYFVYYKVEAARRGEVERAVTALFATLERECGVRGRWMRRRDDPGTYMEVYEDVRDAERFEAVIGREAAKLDLQRRVERFISA